MKRFIQARPTPAMAVAFTALLLALGGTAVALPAVINPAASGIVSLSCNAGEQMLSGGGFFNLFLQANKGIQASFPLGNGWAVVGRNNTAVDQRLNVNVLCLQN